MKQHDRNDFCVLYVEPTDEKAEVFNALVGHNKPVVLMLADQIRVLQRPEDFAELKHIKRQLPFPIVFVATTKSDRLLQLAGRTGFPIYPSLHAFTDALAKGHLTRRGGNDTSRPPSRQTIPLDSSHAMYTDAPTETTAPLVPLVAPTTDKLSPRATPQYPEQRTNRVPSYKKGNSPKDACHSSLLCCLSLHYLLPDLVHFLSLSPRCQ